MRFYPQPTLLDLAFVLLLAEAAPAVSVRGAGSTAAPQVCRAALREGFSSPGVIPAQLNPFLCPKVLGDSRDVLGSLCL